MISLFLENQWYFLNFDIAIRICNMLFIGLTMEVEKAYVKKVKLLNKCEDTIRNANKNMDLKEFNLMKFLKKLFCRCNLRQSANTVIPSLTDFKDMNDELANIESMEKDSKRNTIMSLSKKQMKEKNLDTYQSNSSLWNTVDSSDSDSSDETKTKFVIPRRKNKNLIYKK